MLDREGSLNAAASSSSRLAGKRGPVRSQLGHHMGQDKGQAESPAKSQARPRIVETLEARVLLSTTNTAAPTTNLRDLTNGPMAKAGGGLTDLYLDYRTAQADDQLKQFDKLIAGTGTTNILDISGSTVGVAIQAIGSVKTLEKSLKADGMDVRSASDGVIAGYLPITMLHQVAISASVQDINPLLKPVVHTEGIAPDQADTALSAALVRSTYGVNGAGIKVGVVSDSVNQYHGGLSDSIATGDLPSTVTDLQDGVPGDTDEGRAILEEIYDIAPGASLYFDSGDGGQQAMATAIANLQAAGCNVIIDDLDYDDEPYFQPGVIDDAITNAVNAGVSYFTAAGNEGSDGFLQAASFVAGTVPTGSGGGSGYLINFDPTGSTPETKMSITTTTTGTVDEPGGDITLEWDDGYNGVTGQVNADLDIYLYNAAGTTIEYESTDNNFATGLPVEDLKDPATGLVTQVQPGTYQVEIVAKNTPAADLPRYYEFASAGGIGLTNVQYTGTRTSILGHAGSADAISIGAVNYASVPSPENNGATIPTDDYTSLGPVIHDRDAAGNLITAVTLQKPDVSATDGNDTSFFDVPTVPPSAVETFSGTSAAAGNAAAVAALLLQIEPTLTPSELLTLLKSTAVPVNGQSAGSYNTAGGHGLIDADLAAVQLESSSGGGGGSGGGSGPVETAPTATIVAVTPDPTTVAVDSIEIDFSQEVFGVDISDLSFSFNGGPNLLTGAQTLTTSDNQEYFLTNLSLLDASVGTYTLTVTAANSGIENIEGTALAFDASTSFTKSTQLKLAQKPSNLTAQGISAGSIRLSWRDNSNNETEFVVQRSTNSTFTSKVKTYTFPPNTTSFTNGGLTAATHYYYRVYALAVGGQSDFSNVASAFTFSRGEVILDDRSTSGVTIKGDWTSSADVAGFYGDDYLQDDDAGKGTKSVTYTPTLPVFGTYFIYAQWTRAADRATKVPFSVYEKPGELLQTVYENERSTGGSGFVLLGEFQLHAGSLSSVVISNSPPGEVIADAIEFLPANAVATPASSSTTTTATAAIAHPATPAINLAFDIKKQPATSAQLESVVE